MKVALFLIHGFASSAEIDYHTLLPYVEGKYDHIESKNLPGHCKKGLDGFTCKETIKFVQSQMEYLENEYDVIDIIGFSLGGALAAYLASHSTKVRNLVLMAPALKYINYKFPLNRLTKHMRYLNSKINKDKNPIKYEQEHKSYYMRLTEDQISMHFVKNNIIKYYNPRTIYEFTNIIKYCKDNILPIEARTLVILGDIDQLVPNTVDEFLDHYCSNKKTILIKNLSHNMLNSIKHNDLIGEIITFLDYNSLNS